MSTLPYGYTTTDGYLNYVVTDASNHLVGVTGLANTALTSVIVPSTILINGTTYTVDSLESAYKNDTFATYTCDVPAFVGTNISSISLPPTLTKIGYYVFGFCSNLTAITLPPSLTFIGSNAFNNTKIVSLVIPSSVTTIQANVFWGCATIKTVILNGIFHTKSSTTYNNNSDYNVSGFHENFTSNGSPDLYYLSQNASSWSSKSTYFGGNAMQSLSYLTDDILFYNITNSNTVEVVNKLGNNLINSASTSITIPATVHDASNNTYNVTSIHDNAFRDMTNLRSILVGSNVTTIGGSVFNGCTNLSNIILPSSVVTIGDNAFNNDKTINVLFSGNYNAGFSATSFNGGTAYYLKDYSSSWKNINANSLGVTNIYMGYLSGNTIKNVYATRIIGPY